MKFSTFELKFEGNETINEIYRCHVKELKETIRLIDQNDEAGLNQVRMELFELMATVENKQLRAKGYALIKPESYGTCTKPESEIQ